MTNYVLEKSKKLEHCEWCGELLSGDILRINRRQGRYDLRPFDYIHEDCQKDWEDYQK